MPAISRRDALGFGRALAALPPAIRFAAAAGALVAGGRILLHEFTVAGIAYYDAAGVLPRLAIGDPLALRREPRNRYDSLAIEVFTRDGAKLGYVPRLHNPPLARLMDAGLGLDGGVVDVGWPLDDYRVVETETEIHILNAGPRRRRVNYGGVLMAIHLVR
jgi:hypothetical protein